jgi:2-methylisocitrate lyase-like PEP mutase family enzyme
MPSQAEKIATFRALHEGPLFVIANAWDAGTALMLGGMGFPAIATSSGAAAGTLGRRDGQVSRDEAIAHAATIAAATDLPVSADLEHGFAHDPEGVAETLRAAAAAGLAGCTIEDATGDPARPLYEFGHAVARIEAAAAAARPASLVLTARAEGFLRGNTDLDEAIRRLRAYEAAGADVLMAPGITDPAQIRAVCAALARPFNFMAGIPGRSPALPVLAECGVRRVSLATSLWRAAMSGLAAAAAEVLQHGTMGYVDTALPTGEITRYFPR